MYFQADDKGLGYPAKSQNTKQERKISTAKEINHQQETPGD